MVAVVVVAVVVVAAVVVAAFVVAAVVVAVEVIVDRRLLFGFLPGIQITLFTTLLRYKHETREI